MSETTFENCKVGDRVWTPFGPEVAVGETNAKITDVDVVTCKAFEVMTDSFHRVSFFLNGFILPDDSSPSCFWSRPEIIAPERPVREEWVEVSIRPFMDAFGIMRFARMEFPTDNLDWLGPIQTVKIRVTR